jgi:hypothetical protein
MFWLICFAFQVLGAFQQLQLMSMDNLADEERVALLTEMSQASHIGARTGPVLSVCLFVCIAAGFVGLGVLQRSR